MLARCLGIALLHQILISAAGACEPARLKFEGTHFAENQIQLEKQQIYFFRGQRNQTVISHAPNSDDWCYEVARSAPQGPLQGCLNASMKRYLVLRDSAKAKVAELRAVGRSLVARLMDAEGKASGKRIQFTQASEKGERVLQVRGWNCPNPKYLSCAGTELKALPNYVSTGMTLVKGPVELSNRLGHYQASCDGVHEEVLKDLQAK